MNRRTECIALQKRGRIRVRKRIRNSFRRVRSCLEVLQSDRKRWNEQGRETAGNSGEQRAIENKIIEVGAESEGRSGEWIEQLKDLVSSETMKKQINESTGSEIADRYRKTTLGSFDAGTALIGKKNEENVRKAETERILAQNRKS